MTADDVSVKSFLVFALGRLDDLSGPTGLAWRKASQLLQEVPPETVTAEIARALKEDREFTVTSARFGVYDFMSDLVKARRKQKRTIERPYLEQLLRARDVTCARKGVRAIARIGDLAEKPHREAPHGHSEK